MQSGWRVGSLFGIPLLIHPSWFVVLVLFALSYGLRWQQAYPQWGTPIAFGTGGVMVLLLFASVLLHELGHSLVARSQGIKVNSITLFLFGGIAAIDRESKTPGQAFQVAIAGPLVSLGVCLTCALLSRLVPDSNSPAHVLLQSLTSLNLVLVLFNLIPGLPLDGGQVLQAAVWKATGSRLKGVHWAARTGKTLGWLGVIFGTLAFLQVEALRGVGLWSALLGFFVLQNATASDRLTEMQEALLQIQASDAMTRDYRVVDANLTLREFADKYLLESARLPLFFAASDGRYRGAVLVDDLRFIERSEWETSTVSRLVQPLAEIFKVEGTTSIVDVIQLMESRSLRRLTVLTPAGAIAGVIDRGDIVRTLAQKLNLQVSESMIQQIKDQGSYPAGLQLGAIAEVAGSLTTPKQ
jgi:Zn-dependent protease